MLIPKICQIEPKQNFGHCAIDIWRSLNHRGVCVFWNKSSFQNIVTEHFGINSDIFAIRVEFSKVKIQFKR